MLRSGKSLLGFALHAQDGEIGNVHEIYFDDTHWTVRYLVVDTGSWLTGKRVLVSPRAFVPPEEHPSWTERTIPVSLTREEVRACPDVSSELPISRQKEMEMVKHYNWPVYWQTKETDVVAASSLTDDVTKEPEGEDSHLRSLREVTGYRIEAEDGEIGHIEDMVLDDEHWAVRYVVADLRNWLPGKKVLVAKTWIKRISWPESRVHIDLKRRQIQESPPYDPSLPVNREQEDVLYDYYGRPKYWMPQ